MSTPTSGLESGEDPDNVPLVHLAQASASPAVSTVSDKKSTASFEYMESPDNTCEDSNGGSVSVQSEEAVGTEGTDGDEDDSDSGEMIVPEFVADELPIDIPTPEPHNTKVGQPGGWPTLEILPGGVIKRGDMDDEDPVPAYPEETDPMDEGGELMTYACAKCPERFSLLFSLVKHVRMHEDERRRLQRTQLAKMNRLEKELVEIKRERLDVLRSYKKQKSEVMSRIALAMGALGDLRDILN